mgnify:CR=1 FL=1
MENKFALKVGNQGIYDSLFSWRYQRFLGGTGPKSGTARKINHQEKRCTGENAGGSVEKDIKNGCRNSGMPLKIIIINIYITIEV